MNLEAKLQAAEALIADLTGDAELHLEGLLSDKELVDRICLKLFRKAPSASQA